MLNQIQIQGGTVIEVIIMLVVLQITLILGETKAKIRAI
jgi:hypothetical protein